MKNRTILGLALLLLGTSGSVLAEDEPLFVCVARDGLSLLTSLSESFVTEKRLGNIQIEREVHETVFTALNAAKADLVMLGWGFNKEQMAELRKAHPDGVAQRTLAVDSAALVTSAKGIMKTISQEQLRKLFGSQVDVNGKPVLAQQDRIELAGEKVRVIALNKGHPTQLILRRIAMNNGPLGNHIQHFNGTDQILGELAKDPHAVALVRYTEPMPEGIVTIGVGENEGSTIHPSEETVRTGAYPISMPLIAIWRTTSPPTVAQFVAYAEGNMGRGLIRRMGYVLPVEPK